MVIFGIGLMIMVAPLTTALMRSIPVRHSGVASAFNNAVSRVGPQLAGALIFIVITGAFYATIEQEVPDIGPSQAQEQVSPLNAPSADAGAALVAAARDASTQAFHIAMVIAALLCLTGAVVNGLGITRKREEEAREPSHAVAPCPQSPPVEARDEPGAVAAGR
jgi:hypothetical protein